jgi:hypothetical protein
MDWVKIYKEELIIRLLGLEEVKNAFPERRFINLIKPQLDIIFPKEFSKKSKIMDIRESIRRWMIIANLKSFSLIKILDQIPKELSESAEICSKYSDIPIGPLDSETVRQMTHEKLKKWREGNIALFYTGVSITNLLGIFVSELFFTIEAMCRAICIGSCLNFAVKSILPDITIQHNEIFKTLKWLADNEKNSVNCKLCPINNECNINAYSKIAEIYELFYHMRAIKDYRAEFYFNTEFKEFLLNEYMIQSFKAACIIDNIMNKLFLNYLTSPLSLAAQKRRNIKDLIKIKKKL